MIIKASINDSAAVATLAAKMWDSHSVEELTAEFEGLILREDAAVFLLRENGRNIGFAQCQLRRDYVEGTDSSPVGYLEGIYVDEAFRHRGYARELLGRCEQWARDMGCTEFASDCELDNTKSLAFHLSVGFDEAKRIICFTKKI